jgi:hypothetical protein
MSAKDQTNFIKLAAKGFKAMAKSVSFDVELKKLALDAAKFARKGYLTFQNWFQKLPYEDKLALGGELSFFTRQTDKTIEKMLKFKFEQKELKDFKDITEDADKGATFTFGRFNPPTVGHVKLATKMKSVSSGHDVLIYTTHTIDKTKNPLTNAQIRKFMNPMLPRGISVQTSASRTVFDVLVDLYDNGYRYIQMVVGSDRIMEFDKLLNKYNGVKSRHGYYNFKSIKVVSAGDRDPDAEGAAGMSASKMRHLAYSDQEDEFIKALPRGYRLGKQLYSAVRKGMGITEDFPDFMLSEVYTDTHVPQVHEWGSQEGREYAQDFTPYEPVVDWRKISSWREQEDLPKKVLAYKEKMYKELKSERDDFTKRYGERADEVMHATAMTMAKRKYGYT